MAKTKQKTSNFARSYRLVFGLLVLVAIVYQLIYSSAKVDFSLANFFSYFTIQSNIIAALVFIKLALKPGLASNSRMVWLRGAAALYMVTTGTVYELILAPAEANLQLTLPWVNTVLHQLMPIVAFVDWCLYPAKLSLAKFKAVGLWLLYPLVYVAYTLVRGYHTGWYPYPFLNPGVQGYSGVARWCLVIAIGIGLVGLALASIAQFRYSRGRLPSV